MPRSRSRAKRTRVAGRRRGYRKRISRVSKRNLTNLNLVSVGKGFPKKMLMTHKYEASGIYNVSAGVMQKVQFSCNGMYDPDISGVGHQPMFFDQMTALYDQYTVIGSKISIELSPATTIANSSLVGLYKDDDTNTSQVTEVSIIGEQPSGYFKHLLPGANRPIRLTSKWSAKKTFGPMAGVGNERYQGTLAQNPTEQTYWTLGIQNLNLGSAQVYLASIKVQYIAVWTELKDFAPS